MEFSSTLNEINEENLGINIKKKKEEKQQKQQQKSQHCVAHKVTLITHCEPNPSSRQYPPT